MVLESISEELAEFGITIDVVKIKRIYPTSAELEQFEDQLSRLLRSIEAHYRIKRIMANDANNKNTR